MLSSGGNPPNPPCRPPIPFAGFGSLRFRVYKGEDLTVRLLKGEAVEGVGYLRVWVSKN